MGKTIKQSLPLQDDCKTRKDRKLGITKQRQTQNPPTHKQLLNYTSMSNIRHKLQKQQR